MSHAYYADAWKKSDRRIRMWHQEYLMKVLEGLKEKQVREIDVSVALGQELMRILDEQVAKPKPVALHDVVPYEDDSLMKPIEPDVLHLLYGSTEKGAAERYLKARYKKAPEDKFYFRLTSNWDYGWQQKQSRIPARDMNRGRCAILRDTFYRKNNLAPDPRHYSQPAAGEVSICSEFYFRLTFNWDYGWQQKQSRIPARDMNRGRCAILRDTFYRKNNLAPDPRHYSQPAAGEVSICSEYSCNFT